MLIDENAFTEYTVYVKNKKSHRLLNRQGAAVLKVKAFWCMILAALFLSVTACSVPKQEALPELGELQAGMPLSQVEQLLAPFDAQLEPVSSADAENLYDLYLLYLPAAQWNGYVLRESTTGTVCVTLRFTPAFTDGEQQIEPLVAGMKFTVSQDESEAFVRWMQHRLKDVPQIPERESGIDGQVYLARSFSELTADEYEQTARLVRSSRAQFATEESKPIDDMAVLEERFSDHLAATRNGQNVPMCRVVLRQNAAGEAVVSMEEYGQALYLYEQSAV